ncbi:MAG: hypothetical protein GY887_16110 [Halieaceae bacterium]|nr:hypothetical protein [Halieaceae bacterium]
MPKLPTGAVVIRDRVTLDPVARSGQSFELLVFRQHEPVSFFDARTVPFFDQRVSGSGIWVALGEPFGNLHAPVETNPDRPVSPFVSFYDDDCAIHGEVWYNF